MIYLLTLKIMQSLLSLNDQLGKVTVSYTHLDVYKRQVMNQHFFVTKLHAFSPNTTSRFIAQ